MPHYRHRDATGAPGGITVIEDKGLSFKDSKGARSPGFEFIDSQTVRAHPLIIDFLLVGAERLWTMDELIHEACARPGFGPPQLRSDGRGRTGG